MRRENHVLCMPQGTKNALELFHSITLGHPAPHLLLGCAASTREPRCPAAALAAANTVARCVHGGCCCPWHSPALPLPRLSHRALPSCTPQLAPCCVAQAKRLAFELLARGSELCWPARLHGGHLTRRPHGVRGCCMLTHRHGLAILACATHSLRHIHISKHCSPLEGAHFVKFSPC